MGDDIQELSLWRAGDKSAGDRLLQKHFASVQRFFRTKVGDDVDDLVQQTFLGCVQDKHRIHDGGFRPYLFGIAKNRLYDRLRQHRARVDLDLECVAHCGTSPSRKVARKQEEQLLLAAMREIPVNAQILLELTYWEGMSGKEAAEVLSIPEHTVRSRLSRAREALRAALKEAAIPPQVAERSYQSLQGLARIDS